VFEKCRRAVFAKESSRSDWGSNPRPTLLLGVPGELLTLLEIALYVEPRSAALATQAFTFEKLREEL
jgi:hypothetical protein